MMGVDASYVPLHLRNLRTDLPVMCDLFIRERGQYVLYREASLPFTVADRDRLLASGVFYLWIRVPVVEDAYPQRHLVALINMPDEEVPPLAKAGLLYRSARSIVRRAIAESVSEQALTDVDHLIATTMAYMARSQNAFPALISMMLHDYSLYAHALNVAVLALGLGKFLGISDQRSLRNLGMGAILHDVGKIKMPEEILQKRVHLSPEEWSIVRRHPTWGIEVLSAAAELPEDVMAIVEQHHERLDGSGYPKGLVKEELHEFSSIVALIDAYDAMTGPRPYRSPYTPFDALSLLKNEVVMPGKLDYALFTSLVRLLGDPSQVGRL